MPAMLRHLRVVALPLGFLLAAALGACGSSDAHDSAATLSPPPRSAPATTPATTAVTTAPSTVQTTTAPATTTTTTATTPPAATTAPATTPTSTQPSGGAPAGCAPAVGGFIRDLHGSDCGVATSVASAWFDAVHDGAAPDSAITAAGYACSATLAGERASVSCSGSGGSVSFTASP
jgi:hypothetical protein